MRLGSLGTSHRPVFMWKIGYAMEIDEEGRTDQANLRSKYRLNRTIPRRWMTVEMWTITCCSSRRLVDHIMRSVYRWSGRKNASWILGAVFLLLASQGWGEEAPSSAAKAQPPVAAYPLELLGLLAPPEARGPLTVTPSISVSEEYNDNVFLDNRRRESDFITSFAPAVTLFVNSPSYTLSAGYSFGADLYARQNGLSNPLARQNFLADGMYRHTPELTLTAIESFAFNRSTNLLAPNTFSTGRQESWINTFTPGVAWQMTSRNALSVSATYTALRFEGQGAGINSDTYGLLSSLSHAFTPRLTGLLGYGFTYVDVREQGTSTTHTPALGLSYRLTQTLLGTVSGGPAITEFAGETILSPAGTATLVQTLPFGSAGLQYVRGVSAAGGFGGATDTQTASGTLTISGWQRGLIVALNPVYSVAESISSRQARQVDARSFTLTLSASYQIARYATVFGGYTFFQQRTSGSSATQLDVDQNRVRFGLQFGYPINFD